MTALLPEWRKLLLLYIEIVKETYRFAGLQIPE
jgi:hypothetical protein